MEKKYWVAFSIALVLLCIVSNVRFRIQKQEVLSQVELYQQNSNTYEYLTQAYKQNLDMSLSIELDDLLYLASESFQNREIESFVMLIGDKVCASCVVGTLQDIEILADEVGYNRVEIIAAMDSVERYDKLLGGYQEYFNITRISPGDLEFGENPVLCVYHSGRIKSMVYIPNNYPEFRAQYFKCVEQLLNTN